jgi:hypothetical protein
MADVPSKLPFAISERLVSQAAALTGRHGTEIHYAIAGVPFRSFASNDLPMTITTAEMRKAQQDVEPEAGEQSLSGWWLRSQSSWHEGAGSRYAESRGEVKDTSRFWQSTQMDVWTPGELKLLRVGKSAGGTVNRAVSAVPDAATYSVVAGQTGAVRRFTNLDGGTPSTTTDLYLNGAVNFTHVISNEVNWYAAGDNGSVYSSVINAVVAPSVWTLTGADITKPTRILWAKHRLWAVNGNKIYVINPAVPGATAATYTHPSTAWVFTDLCDGPGGVFFSGHGDGTSGLQVVSLNTDGSVPTISGAQVTAVLPSDEKALKVSSLASSLICIATNRGVRVAAVSSGGEMIYGPLFMERPELASGVTPSLVSAGRWWWLCWGDEPKCWRIDSSIEVEEGVFAYASDLEFGTSNFTGITVRNERPVVATVGGAVVYRHKTELAALGSLETGRVRFRTEEPKTFRRFDVNAAPLDGTLVMYLITDTSTEQKLITYNTPGQGKLLPADFPVDLGAQRFVSLRMEFQPKVGDLTKGPLLQGLQFKALSATRPQRLISIPLACFDRERWSTGQEQGYDGFGNDRYLALRNTEDEGGVTILQDYTFEPPLADSVRIEEMKLVRTTAPSAEKFGASGGGILIVTLRTLS